MRNKKTFNSTILNAPTERLWDKVWLNTKNIFPHESFIYQVKKLKFVSTVLEVGAGSGADLLELKKLGYKATFSDFSTVAIKNINKRDPRLKMIKCDARHLSFSSDSFDLVYCLGLLEHFSYQDRQKIISELFRVSKKYILIDIPQSSTLTSLVKKLLMIIGKWKYGDEIEFSYRKLSCEVKETVKKNISVCSVYGRELIPLPRNIKNKFFMKFPEKLRKTYIKFINRFYFFCGSLGIIYKKI